MMLLKMNCSN